MMEENNQTSADFSKQIKQNEADVESFSLSLDKMNVRLKQLNSYRATFGETGPKTTEAYNKLIKDVDNATESIIKLNIAIAQQQVLLASQNRIETWGKAYDGVKSKIDKAGEASELFGKIVGESANSFKPYAESLKTAEQVTSKFKEGISKANQAYTTYSEGVASGKSRFEALKDVFPALTKGVEGGTGGMKAFKIALAETGIGLIVIAVAALIEKLQQCKPVMDMINAVTASIGAVMGALANNIVGLFTDPVNTIKNFGKSMTGAAKDAYNLSKAQTSLKDAMSAQGVVNDKINDQIDLLKKQADNAKLSSGERIKALQQQHTKEEEYYNQNSALAAQARDNAVKEVGIKTGLSKTIISDLKQRGVEAAALLLKDKKINEEQFESIKKADDAIRALDKQRTDNTQANADNLQKIQDDVAQKAKEQKDKAKKLLIDELGEIKTFNEEAEKLRTDSITRMSLNVLQGYDREVKETQQHYDDLLKKYTDYVKKYELLEKTDPAYAKRHKKQYEDARAVIIQLKQEETKTLADITTKFQTDDLQKLKTYGDELTKIATEQGKNAEELAIMHLNDEYKAKDEIVQKAVSDSTNRQKTFNALKGKLSKDKDQKEIAELQAKIDAEQAIIDKGNAVQLQLKNKHDKDLNQVTDNQTKQHQDKDINDAHNSGDTKHEFELRQQQLDADRAQALAAAKGKESEILKVKLEYNLKQRELDRAKHEAELSNQQKYLKSVDKMAGTLGNIFGKNTVAAKVAFKAHQAAAAGQVIIDTQKSIMGIWSADAGLPIIGVPKAIVETAIVAAAGASSLSSIIKQKPGFAQGGQYVSDGRGALLAGYSRTDNTNAYLRSGEAVVVSEAMRNPWARNLVSAINVAHGGRDFSVTNPGNGYAVGGIFTDGGNANRYYSQPANDVKDLANTLAYQMLNNFPPIYVDVKDVNNQQNILAQTVNRVNL